jgi:DNA adenine methylase
MKRLPAGRFAQYAEPFCGGGAMFFALSAESRRRFDHALLADKNAELVSLYQAIKLEVEPLVDRLRAYRDEHLRKNDEKRREHFYEVRARATS